MEQLQSLGLIYMGKYLRISSYIRKLFLKYDFATAPLCISLRKIRFFFSVVSFVPLFPFFFFLNLSFSFPFCYLKLSLFNLPIVVSYYCMKSVCNLGVFISPLPLLLNSDLLILTSLYRTPFPVRSITLPNPTLSSLLPNPGAKVLSKLLLHIGGSWNGFNIKHYKTNV
jgi:hypothetical protein